MANEIKGLDKRDGAYRVLFLYPISTPQTYVDGSGATVNVVPTPAPTEGEVRNLLSDGEAAALDNGTAAWEVVTFRPDPTLTPAELLAKVRALYAGHETAFQAQYTERYEFYGGEWDATA